MIWVLLGLLALVPVSGVVLLFLFCGRQKDGGEGVEWPEALRTEPVEVSSDDELTLRGVLVPRKGAKGTVLLFHRRGSSWKRDFKDAARFYYGHGFQLLLVDQRAHDRSGGRLCTYGVWERFDVRGWANYAAFRFGDSHPLFLAGRGLGATAALMASSLELPGNVRGIIADGADVSPYQSLRRIVAERTPLPAGAALRLLNAAASVLEGFSLREYDAVTAVKETAYPLLLIEGPGAPRGAAREIFDACAGEKRFVTVKNAEDGAKAETAIGEFLAEHLKDAPGGEKELQ